MTFAEAVEAVLADARRAMTAAETLAQKFVNKKTWRAKRRRSEP